MNDIENLDRPPAIFIMGPTASGKTALSIALRQRLPVELVSVDSALIYRGMDIGTAKPSAQELALAPHRLIDIRDPAESYSAADFRKDALKEMADITAAGRIPLLVGGTMLYFKALLDGLSPLPSADPQVRQRIEQQASELGWGALHQQLAVIDPVAAARIHPNDPQRLSRALEVFISGKTLTELTKFRVKPYLTGFTNLRLRLLAGNCCTSGLNYVFIRCWMQGLKQRLGCFLTAVICIRTCLPFVVWDTGRCGLICLVRLITTTWYTAEFVRHVNWQSAK